MNLDELTNEELLKQYNKNETSLKQLTMNIFTEYSITDVELMIQINDIAKVIETHQGLAYTTAVSMDDNHGTTKQWMSHMYNEAFKSGVILPLAQKYADEKTPYLAGWVLNHPGKYDWVSSFDFTSLYPSLIRAFNIGASVMIQEHELPEELLELREKFFTYHTIENINRTEKYSDGSIYPLGTLVKKYKGEISDLEEETIYYKSLIDNKEEISKVLRKYDCGATPNGFFYKNNTQSLDSVLMEKHFNDRVKQKREGQRLGAELVEMDKNNVSEDEKHIIKVKKEYAENQSQVLKLLLNSYFGSTSMKHITYSNGTITASSITTSGRCANKLVSLACHNKIQDILGEKRTTDMKHLAQCDTDSFYLDISSIMNDGKFKALSKADKAKVVLKLSNGVFQDVINTTIDDLGYALNIKNPHALQMENEIIADGFVSLAAKRYFARKVVEDGTILAKPKMKSTGISLVSKSTPLFLREKLAPVLEIILDGTNIELNNYISEVREEFGKLNPLEFCRKSKVNNLDYNPVGFKYKKAKEDEKLLTAPINSHASLEYNKYIEKHDLIGKYTLIEKGESIQYVYVKEPNELHIHNSLAWVDGKFADEINVREITDYAIHFLKDFENKVDIIVKPIGWNIHTKTEEMDVW